ncbi:MAG: uracil-DNA glycosylase [Betaproteobacteria bacterium]|nr:uracil-DNA glycosylase [Betaproteobacteria bacterium]
MRPESLHPSWQPLLAAEFSEPYIEQLCEFLSNELVSGKTVFPPQDVLFRALQLISFLDVRVVVLGQDPYHGAGQANGLAFAVQSGLKIPPSLRNIFKEISSDLGCPLPQDSSLLGWARQGVLLLNTVLSVREDEAFSHRNRGWERFTEKVISVLNLHPQPLVFMLWGAPAQEKAALVDDSRHLVLRAPHPSPLSAHRGFLGCGHFSKANEFLKSAGRGQIDWQSVT